MKHSMVLTFLAVALAAVLSNVAIADTNVALNLRYNDPADPLDVVLGGAPAGGEWQLIANTADVNGIAGLSAYLSNLDNTAAFGASTAFGPFVGNGAIVDVSRFADFSGTFNVAFGFNLDGSDPGNALKVGAGSGNGNQILDPLDVQDFGPSAWTNSAVIATGTFSGARPEFVVGLPGVDDETWANDHTADSIAGTGGAAAALVVSTTVRGDSSVVLGLELPGGSGLLPGDTDRDNDVDIADLGVLAAGLTATVGGWNDGDTDGDGDIDIADLGALAASLTASPGVPPAIGVVPEPSSIALVLLGMSALALRRRR